MARELWRLEGRSREEGREQGGEALGRAREKGCLGRERSGEEDGEKDGCSGLERSGRLVDRKGCCGPRAMPGMGPRGRPSGWGTGIGPDRKPSPGWKRG
jgi:hypothetical protein